jgi:DnaJ-class molecular chaperone
MSSQIIICENCRGTGVDSFSHEGQVYKSRCGHCGGHGRVREITETRYELIKPPQFDDHGNIQKDLKEN